MESNSQIKLDAGKFLGKCIFGAKIPALMTLFYALASVIGAVLKMGESAGEEDIKILYTAGIIINVMMGFFLVHAFLFGAKKTKTGFLELPLMAFEVLSLAYYMLYGYIRLSRLDDLGGVLPLIMGWAYAAYILLIAVSCALVFSFVRSGLIIRQMSSMLAFISDLGIIASVGLAASYLLCIVFGKHSGDTYIIFSTADTINLVVAPLLLIGYWLIIRRCGAEIENMFYIIYKRLLKSTPMVDLDEQEEQTEQSEEPKPEEEKGSEVIDYVSVPFEEEKASEQEPQPQPTHVSRFVQYEEEEEPAVSQEVTEETEEAEQWDEQPAEASFLENPEEEAEKEAEKPEKDEKTKKSGKVKRVFAVAWSAIVILVLGIINLFPAIIKGVLYAVFGVIFAIARVRYSITYWLRMVFYDGHISSEKRNKMNSSRDKTLALAQKVKSWAQKISWVGKKKSDA